MNNNGKNDIKDELKVFLSKSNDLYSLLNEKEEYTDIELTWMRALEKLTRKVQRKIV